MENFMLKTLAILSNIEPIKREDYNTQGIKFKFVSHEYGDILRTFNIPKSFSNRSQLAKFLKSANLKSHNYLLKSPIMLCVDLEKQCEGKVFELTLEETGKPKFPVNVLSAQVKYLTQELPNNELHD
jgi:hypothetical protein